MRNGQLTARQEIFAWHYALTGRASRSAVAAGANPASARTRAYRWLKMAEIQDRIEELREAGFEDLKHEITQGLCATVMAGLESGLNFRETRRAIALMNRLGVYQHANSVSKEIEELEERFGVPFEEILDAVAEAQFAAEMAEAE